MLVNFKVSKVFAVVCGLFLANAAIGQKFFTKTGNIFFSATSSMEKIEATNKSANCVFDAASSKIEWGVLLKGFQFEKALMQEHFNENYVESTKFPKSTFKGTVSGFDAKKGGVQSVKVVGDLTIHGVTKSITTSGTMTVKGNAIAVDATFNVLLADYKIDIPSVVKDQIAKSVKINIATSLAAM
jgi:hypothetical protein